MRPTTPLRLFSSSEGLFFADSSSIARIVNSAFDLFTPTPWSITGRESVSMRSEGGRLLMCVLEASQCGGE